MLVASALRVLCQAGYFVLVARMLGPEGFGALVAVLALLSVFVPFAGWGSGNVLVMRAAREPRSLLVHWGNALATSFALSIPLALLAAGLAALLLPSVSLELVALLAVAELLFGRISETCAQAFQALGRMAATALLLITPAAFRFGAAIAFVLASDVATPESWAAFHLGGAGLASLAAFAFVTRRLGWPGHSLALARGNAREGGLFSVSLASTTVHAGADKVLLARFASLDAAGVYGAAFRAVDIALLPVKSMLYATYARFFQRGTSGVPATRRFALRLLPPCAAYGLVAGFGLLLLAPVAPIILGDDFREAADALRWLAVLPLIVAVQYLAADALTGADRQGTRSMLQVGAVVLNIALNLSLIPLYGWHGAAVATLISSFALACALWIALVAFGHRVLGIEARPRETRAAIAESSR